MEIKQKTKAEEQNIQTSQKCLGRPKCDERGD